MKITAQAMNEKNSTALRKKAMLCTYLVGAVIALVVAQSVRAADAPSGATSAVPATVGPTVAQPMTEGKVVKIDAKRGRIMIKHGPIEYLDMPAMTMGFAATPAQIERLGAEPVGKTIQFTAQKLQGTYTLFELKVVN